MPELASVIRPGDGIIPGQACAEPQTLLEALVEQREALAGCRLFLGAGYSGIVRPEHADRLSLASYCGIGANRALADAGALEILRIPYSAIASHIRTGRIRADVVFLQVSPPNASGEYSMGLAADYLIPALETCRAIVAEVNDQVPWTYSEKLLRRSDFSLLVETSCPPAMPPHRSPGETENAIARHAAGLIPDGATLELGIGALPDAVCAYLLGHRRLSIHSGTAGDGIVDLMKVGAAQSAACAVLIGSRRLFELARDNAAIRLRSSEHTHGPHVLAKLERFFAVNSAVEVDLAGRANSEVARGSYVGALGGAPDFIAAANRSPGGASLILVPAARIVEQLSGPVSSPASEAGFVVTEHGIADLRGCDAAERARRLRAIAPRHD